MAFGAKSDSITGPAPSRSSHFLFQFDRLGITPETQIAEAYLHKSPLVQHLRHAMLATVCDLRVIQCHAFYTNCSQSTTLNTALLIPSPHLQPLPPSSFPSKTRQHLPSLLYDTVLIVLPTLQLPPFCLQLESISTGPLIPIHNYFYISYHTLYLLSFSLSSISLLHPCPRLPLHSQMLHSLYLYSPTTVLFQLMIPPRPRLSTLDINMTQ